MKYENKLLKVTNVLLKTTFFSFKYPVDNMLFEMSYKMLCSPILFTFFRLHLRVFFLTNMLSYCQYGSGSFYLPQGFSPGGRL